MKFDPDIALKILKAIEDYPEDTIPINPWRPLVPDADKNVYSFHCRLLSDAGYIEAHDLSSRDGSYYCPRRMRWNGVQFLEQFRNDSLWQRAKDVASEKGVGMALDTLLQIGKMLAEGLMKS